MIVDTHVSIVAIRLITRYRSRVVRIPDAISPEVMDRRKAAVRNGDEVNLGGIVEPGDMDAWEGIESMDIFR